MNMVTGKPAAHALITDSKHLADFCSRLAKTPFITIDTEFLRDKTYWPVLCLVQLAGPNEAAAIDTLAEGLDLAPLLALLDNKAVVKVFHAARQDVEIFYRLSGRVPTPMLDTQVAAMVCGFGDAASYETLAGKLAGARIDKSSRFTDWSRRPLSDKQLAYALSDVTYLRQVHERLMESLEKSGRAHWVEDEMSILTDPATYRADPETAWLRLKTRNDRPRFLSVLKEIAAWREREAQARDLPRNRVIKDETLMEIAAHPPKDAETLAHCRGLSRGFADGKMGEAILAAVARGLATPEDKAPRPEPKIDVPPGMGPLIDLMRVLLKMRCDEHHVAQKLVASSADLEAIAALDNAPVPALSGWRRDLFGAEALKLKQGKLALTAIGRKVQVIEL
jgi:ribonuclease D